MNPLAHQRALVTAVWRTWRGPGLVRRAGYEAVKRSGRLVAHERRWLATDPPVATVRHPGISVPRHVTAPEAALVQPDQIRLYGAVPISVPSGDGWHRHPLTGHRYEAAAHWSTISDASAEAGDIKDVWDPSRLGWLLPRLRAAMATDPVAVLDDNPGEGCTAEAIWQVIEDWNQANPPYDGPNWMCGQEASLRTITVLFVYGALFEHPATTDERRALVARMVHRAVGRVEPTLGYALSQRNNHAISEAGFLWTASVLAPWLPGSAGLRRRAHRALDEATADQFADDGSYSQHSPTYQRVALHVLLWVLTVSRATGEPAPEGVEAAVARSVPHLRALIVPGSGGQVPNLGGNDGALVFDLAPGGVSDFRPVLAHAAAASGMASGLERGPWDEEAAWFGLDPGSPAADAVVQPAVVPSRSTHALSRGRAHAVIRGGPSTHRPAHADQLHLDVWLDGAPVAVDAGSYRYTAPPPWGNALADEAVHNLPRVADAPQAVRAGRFFWRSWQDAEVVDRYDDENTTAMALRLSLPDGPVLDRTVAVRDGIVVVIDQVGAGTAEVRWNLAPDVDVQAGDLHTSAAADGWQAHFVHHAPSTELVPDEDDPTSGWHAPNYGRRKPLTAVRYGMRAGGASLAVFVDEAGAGSIHEVLSALEVVDLRSEGQAAAVASAVASALA